MQLLSLRRVHHTISLHPRLCKSCPSVRLAGGNSTSIDAMLTIILRISAFDRCAAAAIAAHHARSLAHHDLRVHHVLERQGGRGVPSGRRSVGDRNGQGGHGRRSYGRRHHGQDTRTCLPSVLSRPIHRTVDHCVHLSFV